MASNALFGRDLPGRSLLPGRGLLPGYDLLPGRDLPCHGLPRVSHLVGSIDCSVAPDRSFTPFLEIGFCSGGSLIFRLNTFQFLNNFFKLQASSRCGIISANWTIIQFLNAILANYMTIVTLINRH